MRYDQIIKQIAKNEKTTEEAVKKEMEKALACVGWNGTIEEFITSAAQIALRRYIV